MGNIMQRRQFISRLATNSNSPTVEKSFHKTVQPTASLRTFGINSGINPYAGAWTEKEMIHLLRRVTFGASKASVDEIKGMSVSAAVDYLIDNPVQPPTTPVNNYTAGGAADTGGVAFASSWVTAGLPDPTDATIRNTLISNRYNNSFRPWWMGQLVNQKTHILEKITLFWANHFSTNTKDRNLPKAIFQFFKILRSYGLSNFRDLVKQVTVDPIMLYFLSGYTNVKTAPNENYGRELQELFTVGKGPGSHYTEDDVKQAAKVLTGWRVTANAADATWSSSFNAGVHDTTDKTFSAFYNNTVIKGQTAANGANETDALIDMILKTDECAKFIVRKLYVWFVYSDINADVETNVITPLAAVFRSANYDIPTVLKALFKSEHFFDSQNFGTIIKSPVDLYVNMVREFKITLAASPVDIMYAHWKNFTDKCNAESQNIGDPPDVAGWDPYSEIPYYRIWISASSLQLKIKNLKAFAGSGVTVSGVKILIDSVAFNKQFLDAGNPDKVVSNFITYLLPVDLTADQKAYMKGELLNHQANDAYWTSAWNDYLANPTNTTSLGLVKKPLDTLVGYITGLAEYLLY